MDDPFNLPPEALGRIPLFAELAKVLSWKGGPVNWDLARQVAVSVAAGERPSRPVLADDHETVAQGVRLAEMWLEESALVPAATHLVSARAATPEDWAEHASAALAELIDPVASKAANAASIENLPLPSGMDAGTLGQALGQLAPMFMGVQAGTVIGTLSREITGSHELGMPAGEGDLLLIIEAIDDLARGYDLDVLATRQWVALRAAAVRMIFEAFPLVRAHFFSLYHNYVASLSFDISEALGRLQGMDLSDPAKMQDALGDEGLLAPKSSPETAGAAARVNGLLRLIDAHVATAVAAAATRAGDASRIEEAFRRRTADLDRGARMFSSFIGLDPSHGRREASAFVREVHTARGFAALNRMWDEPDAFPSDQELGDPTAWLTRVFP
jgi:putative hydrolase